MRNLGRNWILELKIICSTRDVGGRYITGGHAKLTTMKNLVKEKMKETRIKKRKKKRIEIPLKKEDHKLPEQVV